MTAKWIRFSLMCVGCAFVFLGTRASIVADEKELADFPKLSAATDWPWWRGLHRNGIAESSPVPTKLSDTDNVVWKTEVPGRGHSSPTVVGNRIFLTTADNQQKIHYLLIFDRGNGKLLKQVEVSRGGFPAKNHPKNTEATPSVACDGERLFVTFYHHDQVEAFAFDMNGELQWKKSAGAFNPRAYEYGYAPSPLLYGQTVIIVTEYDGDSFLTALDRKTGDQVWQTARPPMITFSSPVIGRVAGKDQLLLSGAQLVAAYDPRTGKRTWSTSGTSLATCGTMVWDGDITFASGGYPKSETIAIKGDGSKRVLWKNTENSYEQSMLAYDGFLYAYTDKGIMTCWRGTDGKEMWKERLTRDVSASPVLAGGNIYWANEIGTLFVMRANPERFELVAENHIGNESFASPAICGGQVFLRVANRSGDKRQEYLYCFANPK